MQVRFLNEYSVAFSVFRWCTENYLMKTAFFVTCLLNWVCGLFRKSSHRAKTELKRYMGSRNDEVTLQWYAL